MKNTGKTHGVQYVSKNRNNWNEKGKAAMQHTCVLFWCERKWKRSSEIDHNTDTNLGWLGVTQQHWTLAFNVVFTDFGVSNSLNFLPLMTQVYLAARLLPFNLSKHQTNISSPLLVHLLRYLRYKLILTQYSISQGYRLVLSEVHPPAHLLPPSTCQNIRLTFWVYYWFIYTLGILLSYKYYTSVVRNSYLRHTLIV